MTAPTDINIPPPTHSPVLTTPPPIHDEPAPVVVQKQLPTPDEIPPFSEAKSTKDALRIVVMTRLLCDRQSREERVNPVLAANLSLSNPPEAHPIATPDILIDKMFTGRSLQERIDSFLKTRPLLSQYLKKRNFTVEEKIAKLREEYLSLHERWVAHCNALNEQQKTLASEHESHHSGRTTRRSTAITDAVRSDFEMEQIIASLGYDDAMDPTHLSMKNVATIPDMISATNGYIDYLFDDTSKLVENPKEYYAPNTGIDDWTEEEKKIFLDKYAAYPKQFGIIADFIPNKTAHQCVDYYYLHKKQFIDFRRVVAQFAPNKRRRRGMGKKKGNGLLVDIAKHDLEVKGAGSTSTAPAVVARAPRGRKTVVAPEVKKAARAVRRNAVQFQEDTPTSTPTPEPEPPKRGRRRKTANDSATPSAVGSSSLSATAVAPSTPASASVSASAPPSAAVSAAPTPRVSTPTPTSVTEEHDQDPQPELPRKRVRRTRKIKSAATVSDDHDLPSPGPEPYKELTLANGNTDAVDSSRSGSAGKKDKAATPSAANQWSEEEKKLFLALLAQHGDDFRRIASSMPNKVLSSLCSSFPP
ncbi:hypothetical protein CPB84DRAFT_149708 [Gymnopilus junonius]|uniref:SANT domain-containing protein n=1 Tax=Gymnopilus junonius TaxID=109634 RepID=A0A9P5TII6_GYMJU|nr:hypothetical protein CPB84DRAFT_149708 [Gymnopilus junonius]